MHTWLDPLPIRLTETTGAAGHRGGADLLHTTTFLRP